MIDSKQRSQSQCGNRESTKLAPELAPDDVGQGVTEGDQTTDLERQNQRKWSYWLRGGIRKNDGKRISRPTLGEAAN
jgi:hypothetical protein